MLKLASQDWSVKVKSYQTIFSNTSPFRTIDSSLFKVKKLKGQEQETNHTM